MSVSVCESNPQEQKNEIEKLEHFIWDSVVPWLLHLV